MDLNGNPRVRALFATQITCLVVVWAVTLVRFGIKLALKRQRTWDDTWMFTAAALFTTMSALIMRGIALGGIGQDASQLTLQKISTGLQTWYFGEILYGLLSLCIRLSITLFLFQLLRQPSHIWVLSGCLAVVLITTLCFLLATIFQCSPVRFYWGRFSSSDNHGTCSNTQLVRTTAIAHSIVAALSDWIMTLLPATCLWKTRTATSSKITGTGLISLGIFAGIAMIVRIPQIKSVALTSDFLYSSMLVMNSQELLNSHDPLSLY
ncbi:uncharacterized protein BKA55DRAFT_529663 [Fusarium redolens]|uniref:Rhodopsin domain-containing protein n=1 Tax=Fusarium redolens TaxID=48865 RepID=A0A9P9FX49_FUSRE|nr:uncharacterized protein BKA55DRAFT_529663 [Fusarium redolens]KAH7208459.1 hypothetical protein BKA55DRAFT_529663 [Fusarium redolens]